MKNCLNTSGYVKSILQTAKILAAFLLFSTSVSLAETVSRTGAEKMVIGWLKADSRHLGARIGKDIKKTDIFTGEDGGILYYVIYLEPSGFVIVSGDDDVEPIICFAQAGEYDPSDSNPLGALVSRDLPARIAAARDLQTRLLSITDTDKRSILQRAAAEAKAKWGKLSSYTDGVGTLGISSLSDVRVEPLVESKWGQITIGHIIGNPACYNYYTPPYGAGDPDNYPCGCVATVMAQLMRYYQYPAGYNWSNMPLEPDLSTTETQRQTIGDLCFDAAEAVDTVYGSGGSTALLSKASEKLKSSFSYSNSIYGSSPAVGSALNGMVNPNLDAGKPVFLGISNSSGEGHAVISDGYGYNSSTLYHHLNMGWDGDDDAWYALPVIDTSEVNFDTIDTCIYNIFVSGTGEIISGRVTDMAGNPIPDVTVSAKATGTSTYYATTNSKGIYAIANLPSNKNYTVTAVKSPYTFDSQSASIGKSTDSQNVSGNKWGVNFASESAGPPIAFNQDAEVLSGSTEIITLQATDEGLPNPPGIMRFIVTALPIHGRLTDPAAGVIKTTPYELVGNGDTVEYESCSYYVGGDSLEFIANDYGTAPSGGDSSPATVSIDVNNVIQTTFAPSDLYHAEWPLLTGSNQGRTQVIYLSSNIGGAKRLTDLALDIDTAPGQALNNWTIRMKHTSRSKYSSSPYFETSGWTIVYQGNEQPTPIGWRYFHFQNTFNYNGSSNLMIDFSFNNSSSSSDGYCIVTDTGNTRVVMSYGSTGIDPLNWTDGTAPGLWGASAVPNIKLTGLVPAVPIAGDFEPDCDVDAEDLEVFVGSWLSETGEPNFDEDCDIFKPADGIIDFKDLAVLARNWLAEGF